MVVQRRIGFVYNQRVPEAVTLVTRLVGCLGLGDDASVRSADDLEQADDGHPGVDLLITVGGDGTILRAVRIAAPHGIPILGINMGRVGFMTELRAEDALGSVKHYLGDDVRVEERAMLQAHILPPQHRREDGRDLGPFHALNDVVVGGGATSRMVAVEVKIDEALLTVYHADSVIVATATGSTGYALSAGGPILHPLSRDMLLKPVAAHLELDNALVLPSSSSVELAVHSDRPATMNVDGFVDRTLEEGTQVIIKTSPYQARFLRRHPPVYYYATLTQRLSQQRDTGDSYSQP